MKDTELVSLKGHIKNIPTYGTVLTANSLPVRTCRKSVQTDCEKDPHRIGEEGKRRACAPGK